MKKSLLLLASLAALTACSRQMPPRTEYVLGTVCTINLFEAGSDDLYTKAFNRLRTIESVLSANRDDTNVADINAGAGINPVSAQPETMAVLLDALRFAKKTDGAFSPAIGPLVKAWNIGTEYADVPSKKALRNALSLIDYRKVVVDTEAKTVFLSEKGMLLDFGAIAKGYAADEVVAILRKSNVKRAIIDLGGNVYALGEKSRGKPWTIGIQNPETQRGDPILSLELTNESVVTSGVYERYFEKDGKRYHHILDPATGYPAEKGLLSVTIISGFSIDADALSTSAFLLGTEKGIQLVESIEGAQAVFITEDKKVHMTAGLAGKLKILEPSFTLSE